MADTILLAGATRGSSRKVLLVLFEFYQVRAEHCQHRPPWSSRGVVKGMSWLCPCFQEASDVGAEAALAMLGSGRG